METLTTTTDPLAVPAAGGSETMKALVQDGYGRPEEVLSYASVERPAVGDDDVLVRVRAASVNTPDWITVTGTPYVLRLRFGLRQPRTPIRGTDVAGVVEAVGRNVADFAPGDEVFGSDRVESDLANRGTFCELAAVAATQLVEKPADLSFEDAAASVMSGLTALIAIRDVAEVAPGMSVLVNGASGGIGTFAVQMARALGAEVTGVCSTRNVDLVQALGTDRVIDYTRENLTEVEERFNVILDNVMNHPPAAMARLLAPGGLFIPNSVGNKGGMFAGLLRAGRAKLLGLRGERVEFVNLEVTKENLGALRELLSSGEVRAVIDEIFPLSEGANAIARMLGHHARGNVVVDVS